VTEEQTAALAGGVSDRIARLEEALRLGLEVISLEKGWGKYARMDDPSLYEDAELFRNAAALALGDAA
jgi:hypothetical protein